MKHLKSLFIVTLFLLSIGSFAQTSTKIIVVVTKADWCPTCKANGPRVISEVLSLYKEPQVKIILNDLTNEQTKADSKTILKSEGIEKATSKSNTTGEITLINASSKKVISKISVAKSNTEITKAIEEAIQKS